MSLLKQCQRVLEQNWKGKFTIPSPRLYPFQWNWDSGFIALGNLHTNPEHAILEMETLFTGQWKNGFLPHIIFYEADKYSSYFPSADFWNSSVSSCSPESVKTSGITQPPVHGFVLEALFNYGFGDERITNLFKKIFDYHKYLYNYREYNNSGLVAIWHNWESGMDNSVWWDNILEGINEETVENIELHRKDVMEVSESNYTRPKNLDYKRYLYLIGKLRSNNYDRLPDDYPFQILDPVFNAILIRSNESLIKIGNKLGQDTTFLQSKMQKGIKSFSEYLWDNNAAIYFPFDIVLKSQIKKHCSGSYVPLFAGIPSYADAEKLVDNWGKYSNIVMLPSCFPDENGFERKNYWRGPVWVNINWMIWKGLLQYKMYELAEKIRNETISLVEKFGIYEYFDPFKDTKATIGYGGKDFSWTASLIIDMLRNKKT